MQRFILPHCRFAGGQLRIDDADLLHQLLKVLRMRPGDQCVVLDNVGMEYVVEVTTLHKKEAVLQLLEERHCAVPARKVVLCFGYLKGNRNEYLLEKATELGVTDLQPVQFARCQPFPISPNKARRFHAIVKEATEQSEGCVMPVLHDICTLEEVLTQSKDSDKVLAWERHATQGALPEDSEKDLYLFVGPEGGITAEEGEMLLAHGAVSYSLGNRILRAETAVVSLLAKVL